MDKYTVAEEAYKKGREDAIDRISKAMFGTMGCGDCPVIECVNGLLGRECNEWLADWMRGLFKEVEE